MPCIIAGISPDIATDAEFSKMGRTGKVPFNFVSDTYDASKREASARMKKGGSVTAKCKLGRNKPTKMY